MAMTILNKVVQHNYRRT